MSFPISHYYTISESFVTHTSIFFIKIPSNRVAEWKIISVTEVLAVDIEYREPIWPLKLTVPLVKGVV